MSTGVYMFFMFVLVLLVMLFDVLYRLLKRFFSPDDPDTLAHYNRGLDIPELSMEELIHELRGE